MRILLGASLLANAVLTALLLWSGENETPERSSHGDYCAYLKGDLDFFVEGLEKGNDPFYTPIVVRTISRLLPTCFPKNAEVDKKLHALRVSLQYLVAENATSEQKRNSHDTALALFRELRELFGRPH